MGKAGAMGLWRRPETQDDTAVGVEAEVHTAGRWGAHSAGPMSVAAGWMEPVLSFEVGRASSEKRQDEAVMNLLL